MLAAAAAASNKQTVAPVHMPTKEIQIFSGHKHFPRLRLPGQILGSKIRILRWYPDYQTNQIKPVYPSNAVVFVSL